MLRELETQIFPGKKTEASCPAAGLGMIFV
jgi:hypothetical protein